MIKKTVLTSLILSSLLSTSLWAADATKGAPQMTAEQQKMMKAMEDAGKVTSHHKALDYLVGDWKTVSKWWSAPNTTPEESAGTARFEAALDGRFYKEHFDGMMMGKPFQGIGFLGYDNMKKKYTTLWLDNLSTSVFMVDGESSDGGKTIKSMGKFLCPGIGTEKAIRTVMKKVSKNEVLYEHFEMDPQGKEFKALEVVYKRKS